MYFNTQDDLLDEDRLMLDRSPDELGSHGNDMDELCGSDSDLDDDENQTTTDGERVIYPWMKKIHVAGVGKWFSIFNFFLSPRKRKKGKTSEKSFSNSYGQSVISKVLPSLRQKNLFLV